MTDSIVVVGIGSCFGQDWIAWRVIELLRQQAIPPSFELFTCDRPGLRLLQFFQPDQSLILIDAVSSSAQLGHIHWDIGLDALMERAWVSTHGFGVDFVCLLAQKLGKMPARCTLHGIEIHDATGFVPVLPVVLEKAAAELASRLTCGGGMSHLSAKQRQQLKAKAHQLRPVIWIGNKGLTEAVHAEVDRALLDHELIKIRIQSEDRALRQQMADDLILKQSAVLVQMVGSHVTIFRKKPDPV